MNEALRSMNEALSSAVGRSLIYWLSPAMTELAARFGEPESKVVVIRDGLDDAARAWITAAAVYCCGGERPVVVLRPDGGDDANAGGGFAAALHREVLGARALGAFIPAFGSLHGRRLGGALMDNVFLRGAHGTPGDDAMFWHRDLWSCVPALRVLWIGGRFEGGDLELMTSAGAVTRHRIPPGHLAAFNLRHIHRVGGVAAGWRVSMAYTLLFETDTRRSVADALALRAADRRRARAMLQADGAGGPRR